MQLIHDISSAEEWIKERQDAVDRVQLTNQPIDRSETETRIAVLRKIGNEQQTGESLIHAAIGMMSDSVVKTFGNRNRPRMRKSWLCINERIRENLKSLTEIKNLLWRLPFSLISCVFLIEVTITYLR